MSWCWLTCALDSASMCKSQLVCIGLDHPVHIFFSQVSCSPGVRKGFSAWPGLEVQSLFLSGNWLIMLSRCQNCMIQGSQHQGKSGKVREKIIFLESQGKSGNLFRFLGFRENQGMNICPEVRESQGKLALKSQGKSGIFVRAYSWEPWW